MNEDYAYENDFFDRLYDDVQKLNECGSAYYDELTEFVDSLTRIIEGD